MKKFITHVLIIILAVFIFDFAIGFLLDKMFSKKSFIQAEVAYNNKYELVLLGASEMNNQYVTRMIADSLGISAYNFGSGGQNIYYQYILLNLMLNHGQVKPKYVIMETQEIDFYDTPKWNTEKLNVFYPMYNLDNVLRNVVNLQGWKKTFMLQISRCYKHNSKLLYYFVYLIKPEKLSGDLGYTALEPVRFEDDLITTNEQEAEVKFDEQKIEYLNRFIHLCKENNIRLVFVNAPYYELCENIVWTKRLKKILDKEGIAFLNYDNDPYFTKHKELYYNRVHFNKYGAVEYTNKIIPDLKRVLLSTQ